MIPPETAERVREEIDTGGGRSPDVNRSGVEPGEGMKFLLAGSQRGERLACARGKHAASFGEAAPASVPLDEPLSRGILEEAKVLARTRLSDADGLRGSGDASPALDFHQQTETCRIPEERKCPIGHDDACYRGFRLAR
jgi:hypothetical protein